MNKLRCVKCVELNTKLFLNARPWEEKDLINTILYIVSYLLHRTSICFAVGDFVTRSLSTIIVTADKNTAGMSVSTGAISRCAHQCGVAIFPRYRHDVWMQAPCNRISKTPSERPYRLSTVPSSSVRIPNSMLFAQYNCLIIDKLGDSA